MITPERAMAACTRAAEGYALTEPWPRAVHLTVRSLIDRLAVARGLKAPLEDDRLPAAEAALDDLGPLDGWHVFDLGEIHQRLLELTPARAADGTVTARRKGLAARGEQGSYYTPPEIADAMCVLSIGPLLNQLGEDPDPGAMFDILAIDPACGAGVFLIAAARLIAGRLAERVSGISPAPPEHLRHALPVVMRECVFGIDIDPVAVDLARMALWLEVGGREPFAFMDRNVTVGDPLDLEQPPAFTERRGEPATAEERRKAYAEVGAP